MRGTLAVVYASAALIAAAPSEALILPPDGIELNHIHVQFEWAAVGGADQYQLIVVVDDGAGDPFAGATPVVDTTVAAAAPRAVVTSSLQFGEDYAWHARAIISGSPQAWDATHRFTTAVLPAYMPTLSITLGSGTPEPGLTLFNISSRNGTIPNGFAVAVDLAGDPVWFLEVTNYIGDLRLLDNGRLLLGFGSRAWELMLNGQIAWASPDDSDLDVHHEAFPMPNGNVLMAVQEYQDVLRDSELQSWRGDRFVEIDRTTKQVVWEWNTFDHLSTLDFDDTVMQTPSVTQPPPNGSYYWTHSNAVIYNPLDDSVYVSIRHLSRVVRIDYATGNVVYQMGFGPPSMPSGDVDFGDNLFSFQHAPELLPNGNMVLYDNGNRRDHIDQTNQTGVTKAIELQFTGTPPTGASIVWEWTLPAFNGAVGDADRLPGGNTLVTAGPSAKLYEVDAAGSEVWRLELPSGLPTYSIYRAERIPALIVDVPGDTDGDSLADVVDNCPDVSNLAQADTDGDTIGNACDDSDSDTDDDGLPDFVETDTGVFISANNTGSDPLLPDTDGDMLIDGDEVNIYGTDPNVADTDVDGLNDFDELTVHGTDPTDPDSDNDGWSDGAEFAAGTDPNDSDSVPFASVPTLSGWGIAFLAALMGMAGFALLRRNLPRAEFR